MLHWLKQVAKRVFFPGLDLHTRCRYRFLPALFRPGRLSVLDAGCGNGALSYAAYRRGSCVLGVSFLRREVDGTSALFDQMGIPRSGIELKQMNIYDLRSLEQKFDQIICSETLEHIKRDREVVQTFADLLKPDGRLILCCPHSLHPEHNLGRTDEPETGYHVRDGYTLESYQELLEPAGLHIAQRLGLGSPLLVWLDNQLRRARHRVGDFWAFPMFLFMLPLTWLDYTDPKVPFSLVVVAEKIA